MTAWIALSFLASGASHGEPVPQAPSVEVWPQGKMPGKAAVEAEAEVAKKDGFHRITNIGRPTLTLHPARGADGFAPAVIVCPGGAYKYVVIDKEGSEIAGWLNSLGISALVLKYRTPDNREGALQDMQRAISLTRSRAKEWRIDPERIGVIGFSAGGHLVARASTSFHRSYAAIDEVDRQSCRPDFSILVYPAYLGKGGEISPELKLPVDVPPILIIHSEDDSKYVAGSKLFSAALEAAGSPHEFTLYRTGGHGYGLHCSREARKWPEAAVNWLRKDGLLAR